MIEGKCLVGRGFGEGEDVGGSNVGGFVSREELSPMDEVALGFEIGFFEPKANLVYGFSRKIVHIYNIVGKQGRARREEIFPNLSLVLLKNFPILV